MVNKYITGTIVFIIFLLLLCSSIYNSQEGYYCQDKERVMKCLGLSSYYSMENGKCRNIVEGNRLCRTGWWKITEGYIVRANPVILEDYDGED